MSIFETTLPFERLYTINDEDDMPCDICGEFPEDCECPECAECGEVGNPNCVDKHMPSEMWTTKTRLCTICGKSDIQKLWHG